MENLTKLADLLFPHISFTPKQLCSQYPIRNLPSHSWVTRFAPSPTGFIHIGGIFSALISRKLAQQTHGIFYLRIEDTDKKREILNGTETIIQSLLDYGLEPYEGPFALEPIRERGDYGPYVQSHRIHIYETFAKDLVSKGLAYPCFCSEEEIEEIRSRQRDLEVELGYYGSWAKCRNLSYQEVTQKIAAGIPFTIRLRSPYPVEQHVFLQDKIRGEIRLPENYQDVVLLKVNKLPTYHFAHVIDDSLMGTNLVIRGEEWIPSVPLHIQLFQILGQRVPEFAHIAPIAKDEGTSRRKLSKRKDPEASVKFYAEKGYPPTAVIEYLLNLANSDYEDWRRKNPSLPYSYFELKLSRMGVSSMLFDIDKLNSISKEYISRLLPDAIFEEAQAWARYHDPRLAELLGRNKDYSMKIFGIGRLGKSSRKDLTCWTDIKRVYGFFFDEYYSSLVAEGYNFPDIKKDILLNILNSLFNTVQPLLDKESWLEQIKNIAETLGFARESKIYRQNHNLYLGQWGDVMMVLRVAITGKQQSPDCYEIVEILGSQVTKYRIERAVKWLSET